MLSTDVVTRRGQKYAAILHSRAVRLGVTLRGLPVGQRGQYRALDEDAGATQAGVRAQGCREGAQVRGARPLLESSTWKGGPSP